MNPDTVQVIVRVVAVGEVTWRLLTGPGEGYEAADVLTVGACSHGGGSHGGDSRGVDSSGVESGRGGSCCEGSRGGGSRGGSSRGWGSRGGGSRGGGSCGWGNNYGVLHTLSTQRKFRFNIYNYGVVLVSPSPVFVHTL